MSHAAAPAYGLWSLAPWLSRRFPGLDPLGHDAGHLWNTVLGLQGDPHASPIHLLSNVLIAAGFWLLASARPVRTERGR